MLVVGNWKAYVETRAKARLLASGARRLAGRGHEIVVAPSSPYLGLLVPSRRPGSRSLKYAVQDLSATEGGAATGEVSAAQLAGLGISYAILGHSERRAAGESDAQVAEKVARAHAKGIVPIICVGETERDPEALYLRAVRAQVASAMAGLGPKERLTTVLAYEPVWAIGRGAEAIGPTDLAEMVAYIRKGLGDLVPAAEKVRILYGGSVSAANARLLSEGTGIDGFLVGRASTDAPSFSALVRALP